MSSYQVKYLFINLSTNKVNEYEIRKKYLRKYIGGKALAARLLLDLIPKGIKPLSAENIIIINTGPLVGTGAPSTSRFNITTKNLATGGIATSNSGGNFGIKLRKSGCNGIIIKGRAKAPVYIEIINEKVKILPAKHIWGMNVEKTQECFDNKYGKLVIGPAGENLVSFASVVSQERVSGRTGIGAIMGFKNLKAIVAYGDRKIPVFNKEKYKAFIKTWIKRLKKHIVTGSLLAKYGTMWLSKTAFDKGIYPVKNFKETYFNKPDKLTGKYVAKHHLNKNSGCVSCTMRCGRVTDVTINNKVITNIKGPEYETTGLLGPNILNDDFNRIILWNYLADIYGMDTISLGNVLAFSMELKEKGLADHGLQFNNYDSIEKIIRDIAYRKNKGDELANGVKWLSEKYGGKDFAMHAKGLELPAFNPRMVPGLGLGFATSNRGGCHLNGGYLAFLEGSGPLRLGRKAFKSKAALNVLFQNFLESISSCGQCIFTLYSIFPNILFSKHITPIFLNLISFILSVSGNFLKFILKNQKVLSFNLNLIPYPKALEYVTGKKMTLGRFLHIGELCYNLERMFNIREGIDGRDDKLCKRGLKSFINKESSSKNTFYKMLKSYYKFRGWDKEGIPTEKKLNKLGINDIEL